MLECLEGTGIILFAAVHDTQKVVTLDAGGMQSELFVDFLLGLFD
jgi:hypothetical protein